MWERFLRHASLDTLNLAVRLGLLAPLFAAMHPAPPVVTALIMGRPDAFVARLIEASHAPPPQALLKTGVALGRGFLAWWHEAASAESLATPSPAVAEEEVLLHRRLYTEEEIGSGTWAPPGARVISGALPLRLAVEGLRAQTACAIVKVAPTLWRQCSEEPLLVRLGKLYNLGL